MQFQHYYASSAFNVIFILFKFIPCVRYPCANAELFHLLIPGICYLADGNSIINNQPTFTVHKHDLKSREDKDSDRHTRTNFHASGGIQLQNDLMCLTVGAKLHRQLSRPHRPGSVLTSCCEMTPVFRQILVELNIFKLFTF